MSKELEALNEIKIHKIKVDVNIKYDDGNETQYRFETIRDMFPNQFDIIENALKRLKALEILKRELQYNIDFVDASDFRAYIDGMICCENKEEYDLLKEVLL